MIDQSETEVEFNEPNSLNEKLFDHQIKVTLGITVLLKFSGLSDVFVYHLDVESIFPSAEVSANGSTVRRIKYYVIWVQIDVNQICFYLPCFVKF